MTTRKTAIAVPEDLLRRCRRCRVGAGESRSRFINTYFALPSGLDAMRTSRRAWIRSSPPRPIAAAVAQNASALDRAGGWLG